MPLSANIISFENSLILYFQNNENKSKIDKWKFVKNKNN